MNVKEDSLHTDSIIIDGLNVSAWDRDVFKRLKQGGVTAVNATSIIWENFREAIYNIEGWNRNFRKYGDLIAPVRKRARYYDTCTRCARRERTPYAI